MARRRQPDHAQLSSTSSGKQTLPRAHTGYLKNWGHILLSIQQAPDVTRDPHISYFVQRQVSINGEEVTKNAAIHDTGNNMYMWVEVEHLLS